MRLQQIFQIFSRLSAKPVKAGAEAKVMTACEATRSHRALDQLDLQAAIIHHLEWCVLFNEHLSIETSDRAPLEPLPGATDSNLGRWLQTVRNSPTVSPARRSELHNEHDRFHQLARQALALARQGRMDLASTLLNTDFERSRARILALLRDLQKP